MYKFFYKYCGDVYGVESYDGSDVNVVLLRTNEPEVVTLDWIQKMEQAGTLELSANCFKETGRSFGI